MTRNFRPTNGFTLIELIVVISLISLMLFLVVPKFRGDILSDNTKELSRWIMVKVADLKERAVREQKLYILHVSLDSNRFWISHETTSQEELDSTAPDGYELPEDFKLMDVEYPDYEKISAGQADIYFHEKGYSDKAIIHIENAANKRLSFLIEPFLTRVRLYETYVGFEN